MNSSVPIYVGDNANSAVPAKEGSQPKAVLTATVVPNAADVARGKLSVRSAKASTKKTTAAHALPLLSTKRKSGPADKETKRGRGTQLSQTAQQAPEPKASVSANASNSAPAVAGDSAPACASDSAPAVASNNAPAHESDSAAGCSSGVSPASAVTLELAGTHIDSDEEDEDQQRFFDSDAESVGSMASGGTSPVLSPYTQESLPMNAEEGGDAIGNTPLASFEDDSFDSPANAGHIAMRHRNADMARAASTGHNTQPGTAYFNYNPMQNFMQHQDQDQIALAAIHRRRYLPPALQRQHSLHSTLPSSLNSSFLLSGGGGAAATYQPQPQRLPVQPFYPQAQVGRRQRLEMQRQRGLMQRPAQLLLSSRSLNHVTRAISPLPDSPLIVGEHSAGVPAGLRDSPAINFLPADPQNQTPFLRSSGSLESVGPGLSRQGSSSGSSAFDSFNSSSRANSFGASAWPSSFCHRLLHSREHGLFSFLMSFALWVWLLTWCCCQLQLQEWYRRGPLETRVTLILNTRLQTRALVTTVCPALIH